MKKTKLDYINIFFVIILAFLIVLNFATRIINKEQDKIFWNAEITSVSKKSAKEDQNTIKIIDVVLYNNFSHSERSLNYDSERKTGGKINSISKKSILFNSYGDELLPDSLSLKYFSADESKFYLLNTKLPYEKIRNIVNRSRQTPNLVLEIQQNGIVSLKISLNENKKTDGEIIQTFKSKKTTGKIEELVFEKSLGKSYNRYEGIENIKDFSDLHQNRYLWSIEIEKEAGDQLTSIYAYSFNSDRIEILEENETIKLRNIPREIYIYWENGKKYDVHYNFDPSEIVNACRELNKIDQSEPLLFTVKIFKDSFAQCEISKNDVVIPLKNLYPKKP